MLQMSSVMHLIEKLCWFGASVSYRGNQTLPATYTALQCVRSCASHKFHRNFVPGKSHREAEICREASLSEEHSGLWPAPVGPLWFCGEGDDLCAIPLYWCAPTMLMYGMAGWHGCGGKQGNPTPDRHFKAHTATLVFSVSFSKCMYEACEGLYSCSAWVVVEGRVCLVPQCQTTPSSWTVGQHLDNEVQMLEGNVRIFVK